MGKRLWTKFALSHLAIAVMAVALAAILFNLALSKKFQGYVEENQRLRDEQMVVLLGSFYEKEGRWDPQKIQEVLNLWMMSGREVTVLDSQRRYVVDCWDSMREMGADAQTRMTRMGMMCGWGWAQRGLDDRAPRTTGRSGSVTKPVPNVEGHEIPVFVGQNQVGTAVIRPLGKEEIFSSQDLTFKATVNRWLWGVALGAGTFALLVSLGMARRLSKPIQALTRAAQNLENGDLTQRVGAKGKDEVEQLAKAFNHLAESLERQEKYRKKLTGDLAHELRTPLANLQTHIEALIDGVLPSTPENLTSIHEEILRLGRLVGNLEELNRAEASRLNLKREKTDLRALVEKMTSRFQPQFSDKGVNLKVSFPQRPIETLLDQDRFSQVINNLLSNALKFTPEGGSVEVVTKRQGQEVQISVRDTGIGIPEKDILFIFERFFRGRNGDEGSAKGSGIGLTIAKELTEAHGGKIEVKSTVNRGTEFTLRLPLS